jgi:PEGA domain
MNQQNIRFAFYGLVAVVVIVLFYGAAYLVGGIDTGTMRINLSPADATVLVDGKKVGLDSHGATRVHYGDHSLEISRLHFFSEKQNIHITKDQTTSLAVVLQPNSQEGRNLVASPDQANRREAIAGQQYSSTSKSQAERTPLIRSLPYIASHYRIDYGVSRKHQDDPTEVAIYITADSASARYNALTWIRQRGTDPSDLELIFR